MTDRERLSRQRTREGRSQKGGVTGDPVNPPPKNLRPIEPPPGTMSNFNLPEYLEARGGERVYADSDKYLARGDVTILMSLADSTKCTISDGTGGLHIRKITLTSKEDADTVFKCLGFE